MGQLLEFGIVLGTSHAEKCGYVLFHDCDRELLDNSLMSACTGPHSTCYPLERMKGKAFFSLNIVR